MIKRIYLITVCFFVIINLFAQSELLTIAEESNFLTTSKNEEVIGFINQLKKLTKIFWSKNILPLPKGMKCHY